MNQKRLWRQKHCAFSFTASSFEIAFLVPRVFGLYTLFQAYIRMDRPCGLVIRVSGYRSRGPGSIHGATRVFLRSSGPGTGSTQPRDDN
jgi:hypothetical protein